MPPRPSASAKISGGSKSCSTWNTPWSGGDEQFSFSATRAVKTPVARPSPRPHAEQEQRRPPFASASTTTANPSDPKLNRLRVATRASRVPRYLRTRNAPAHFSRARRRVAAAESKHSLVAARSAPKVRPSRFGSAKSKG